MMVIPYYSKMGQKNRDSNFRYSEWEKEVDQTFQEKDAS